MSNCSLMSSILLHKLNYLNYILICCILFTGVTFIYLLYLFTNGTVTIKHKRLRTCLYHVWNMSCFPFLFVGWYNLTCDLSGLMDFHFFFIDLRVWNFLLFKNWMLLFVTSLGCKSVDRRTFSKNVRTVNASTTPRSHKKKHSIFNYSF